MALALRQKLASRLCAAPVRLVLPLATVITITAIGTVGYAILGQPHGKTWMDALYMTVITITTVGYSEVIPLNRSGQVFTMFIAITGIGSLFYGFSAVMEYWVSQRLLGLNGSKRMQQQIDQLSGHILLAGLGRVGRQAAFELEHSKRQFMVIDPSDDAERYATQHGWLFLQGDSADDAVLEHAGVSRANGIIVTTGDDAQNLYTVLSARVQNPQLYIVSRAVDENTVVKLLRAGANRAISPYAIGGRRLAHLMLSPTVVDFFDTVLKRDTGSLSLEDITVPAHSTVIGQTLRELRVRRRSGATVLVIFRGDNMITNPAADWRLEAADRLLAIGTVQQLDALELLVADALESPT